MRPSFKPNLLILGIALVAVSCDKSKETAAEYRKRLPEMVRSGIVAGLDEKTFEENYGVKLSLPMPESDFLALLKRLGLEYRVASDRAKNIGISPPLHSEEVDLSEIQREYRVFGEVDRVRRVGRNYEAYIDRNGQVVYLENSFVYYDAPF